MKLTKKVLLCSLVVSNLLVFNNTLGNEKIVKASEYRNRIFYDNSGKPATGWYDDGKAWYYFKNGKKYFYEGKYASGWYDDGTAWYFFKDGSKLVGYGVDGNGKKYFYNGKYASGWFNDGNAWYFFQDGSKHSGYGTDGNGKKYFYNGKYASGWFDDGSAWYFFKDGSKHRGYGVDGNGKRFFDNGKYANWWYDDGTAWYFFQDGVKFTGRAKDASGTKDFINGKYASSARNKYKDGIFYDENGGPANGWYSDGTAWYFFKDGYKHHGYGVDGNGKKYFYNGKYASGWFDDGSEWYFFKDGSKHRGYGVDGNGKRFFDNGKYANWWYDDGTAWYFFQDGVKFTGRAKDASGTRDFVNGKYSTNVKKKYKDGLFYDDNGVLASGWYDDGSAWYFFKNGKKLSGYGTDANGKKFFYNGKYAAGWYDDGTAWYFFQDGEKFTGKARDESGLRDFVNGKYRKVTSQSEFIDKITPSVLKAVKGKGLFPSIAIAQACLETRYGNDGLSPAPIYNLFGIKATKNTPASRYVEIKTAEYNDSGEKYYIIAKFMKFTDYDDSCEYYSNLFTRNSWLRDYYKGVLAAKTPEEAAKALTGTYATDPNYGEKLLEIIEKHGLKALDKKIYKNGVKP